MVNPPVKTLTHGANAAFNWRNSIMEDQKASFVLAAAKNNVKIAYGTAQSNDSSRKVRVDESCPL